MTRERRLAAIRRVFSVPRLARTAHHDVDDEIRFHIESRVADLVARGLSDADARETAMREYGDVVASRHELTRLDRRRLARIGWVTRFETLRQDLRYAARGLRRQPAFALSVIIVLSLGIGANATMFGVIDQLLLQPPPGVADPERVVTVDYLRTYEGATDSQDALSYPQYLDLEDAREVFAGVAGYTEDDVAVGRGPDATRLRGMRVTPDFFSTFGVRARLGRVFLPEDAGAPVAPNVAVISYGYWQRRFSGRTDAVGAVLQIGGARFTIVGVAPRRFTGGSSRAVDIWLPLTAGATPQAVAAWARSRNGYFLEGVARLRTGVSRERAAAVASRILRANMLRDGVAAAKIAEGQPRFGFTSVLPREARANDADAKVAVLLGAVSLLVLLLAAANVANLQLARGLRRRREFAVRTALGAGAGRLFQQLLTEGVLLSLLGGVAALLVAWGGGAFIHRAVFSSLDWEDAPPVDLHVLAYAAGAALAAALFTGIIPALQARDADAVVDLKEGAREGSLSRSRTRLALLVVQAALSAVMLVGTGLFVRSLRHVQSLPIGMEPDRVLVASISLTGVNYTDAEIGAMYQRLLDAAKAFPGIESAAIATSLPFSTSWGARVSVPGRDSLPRVRDGGPYFNGVTPGYIGAMGMHVLRGRDLGQGDRNPTRRVIIVNQTFARLVWPGQDPIGRCVRLGSDTAPCAEVVGVVANPRRQAIIEDVSLQLFLPIEQAPNQYKYSNTLALVIRPKADVHEVAEPLRRYLQTAVPNLPYLLMQPMADLVNPQMRSWRMGATVFAAFGGLALMLAMVGLYSLLSYDVAQRTHELGIRVALGAHRRDLVRMVVASGTRVIAVGAALGTGIVLVAGRFVQPLLFETSARQPSVLAGAIAVLLVVALLATLVPTRRALAVDPLTALRAE